MSKKWWILAGLPVVMAGIILLNRCANANGAVYVNLEKIPYKKLSEYSFFKGQLNQLSPNDRVLPYDLNSALFSDYAHKARFVWMPEGNSAQYSPNSTLNFPEGAVLIKNFYYENDERQPSKGKRIIETRLLVHKKSGWEAYTYVWNNDQTEAQLELAGDDKNVEWINAEGKNMKVQYSIPNKNQCKGCHNINNTLMPIGPKVRNLNKIYAYSDGNANQLQKWASIGYLNAYDPNASHPKIAAWNDSTTGSLEERAKAYLEINCGHCHNPDGPANTSGLFLTMLNSDPNRWGICKSPVAAGRGAGNKKVDIQPGDAEASILFFRMNSANPGIMMPELGRKLIHNEGIALIRDWINSMEPSKCNEQ